MIAFMSDATRLLNAVAKGDPRAPGELLPLVYQELRRLARAHMAQERAGHTLQATALVHEAYVRLLEGEPANWDGRRHFFAAAAEAMRRILVEHARRRQSLKRGGDRQRVDLEDGELPVIGGPFDQLDDLLTLDAALDQLAKEDPGKAELVNLLYFAGLSLEEAGAALGISRTSVHRQWVYARAWLRDAMSHDQ